MRKSRLIRIVLGLVLAMGIAVSAQAYSESRFADCEITCGESGNGCTLVANDCTSCSGSSDPDSCEIEFEGCTGGTGCICSGGWDCEMYYLD